MSVEDRYKGIESITPGEWAAFERDKRLKWLLKTLDEAGFADFAIEGSSSSDKETVCGVGYALQGYRRAIKDFRKILRQAEIRAQNERKTESKREGQ